MRLKMEAWRGILMSVLVVIIILGMVLISMRLFEIIFWFSEYLTIGEVIVIVIVSLLVIGLVMKEKKR